jgi:hypothetical protein
MSASSSSPSGFAPSEVLSTLSDCYQLERACRHVHRRLAVSVKDILSVSDHKFAVTSILKARDLLLLGCELSHVSQTCLLCSGVACMRRIHADVEREENARLLSTTLVLIFALLVLAQGVSTLEEDSSSNALAPSRVMRADEELLRSWRDSTLADVVLGMNHEHKSSWSQLVRCSSSVSAAALREGRYASDPCAMKTLQDLSTIFFTCNVASMMLSLFSDVEPSSSSDVMTGVKRKSSFLTLDTVSFLNDANDMQAEKLASLVDAAESEVGQTAFRDLILSFKLPRSAVGIRRVLLLSRDSNTNATKNYAEILNAAHESAMRGTTFEWETGSDPIHKVSAVLAGLAIILANDQTSIRKGDAFAGRVMLPFLECSPSENRATRLGMVEETGEWIVFHNNSSGKPRVRFRGSGFGAFCEAALLFSTQIKRRHELF